jgi:o-succinylbenzoate synthase
LTRIAASARRRWTRRDSLVVQLGSSGGYVGQGEVAPLPGYSRETLDECARSLGQLDPTVVDGPLDEALSVLARLDLPPAARLGLETARLDLEAQRRGVPLATMLLTHLAPDHATAPVPTLPLAYLLSPEAPDRELDAAWARGYTHIKLKVGGHFDDELGRLERLRARLGPTLRLRLDVNGGWTIPRAMERLRLLAPLSPEFVEQPVAAAELPALVARTAPVGAEPAPHRWPPLAADESLALADVARQLLGAEGCATFVLKPAMLGGLTAAWRLGRQAHAQGRDVVVSHLFDGPIALHAAAALALALAAVHHRPTPAQGLAPHAGLDAWPAVSTGLLRDAQLQPSAEPGLGLPPWPWGSTPRG